MLGVACVELQTAPGGCAQPVPKDLRLARRALFFVNMPDAVTALQRLSVLAYDVLLSGDEPSDNSYLCVLAAL